MNDGRNYGSEEHYDVSPEDEKTLQEEAEPTQLRSSSSRDRVDAGEASLDLQEMDESTALGPPNGPRATLAVESLNPTQAQEEDDLYDTISNRSWQQVQLHEERQNAIAESIADISPVGSQASDTSSILSFTGARHGSSIQPSANVQTLASQLDAEASVRGSTSSWQADDEVMAQLRRNNPAAMSSPTRETQTNHTVSTLDGDTLADDQTPGFYPRGVDAYSAESHFNPHINSQPTSETIGARPAFTSIPDRTRPLLDSNRASRIRTYDRDRMRYSWQSFQEDKDRPRIHIVKLFSETTSSSAGFPGGEALQFSISSEGRRIAAYNSARLYILQSAALPLGVSQDYALKRRPIAVQVVDDGNALAILADPHTVNVYDLGNHVLQRVRTLKLDFPAHCIALSPTAGLLATAYEAGIEVFSLAASALPTDRRAVRSHQIDHIAFSSDCSTLLGTTTRINASSTVIVSVPVFPAAASGVPTHDELKAAWCCDILQPEIIRNSSHASFYREERVTSNERLFAWNGSADTFGLLNVADLQYGNIDFPVIISPPLSTCGGLGAAIHSCPCIDETGGTVAMIVNDRTVRLYTIPNSSGDDGPLEAHSIDHALDESYGNAFTDIRWVCSPPSLPAPLANPGQIQGRLIVASPGGVIDSTASMAFGSMDEGVDDLEGGRIIIFDFDPQFAGEQGQTFSLTLGSAQPQRLDEAEFSAAEEVDILRRRTTNQKKGGDMLYRPVQLGRAATTFTGRNRRGRREFVLSNSNHPDTPTGLPDLVEDNEALDAFEQPYQQSAPRSQASLQRSATNVQRHRFQTLDEREREHIPLDSTGDALSLPEYTETPNAPLPSRYRALAGLDQPAPPPMNAKVVASPSGELARRTSSTRQPNAQMPAVTSRSTGDVSPPEFDPSMTDPNDVDYRNDSFPLAHQQYAHPILRRRSTVDSISPASSPSRSSIATSRPGYADSLSGSLRRSLSTPMASMNFRGYAEQVDRNASTAMGRPLPRHASSEANGIPQTPLEARGRALSPSTNTYAQEPFQNRANGFSENHAESQEHYAQNPHIASATTMNGTRSPSDTLRPLTAPLPIAHGAGSHVQPLPATTNQYARHRPLIPTSSINSHPSAAWLLSDPHSSRSSQPQTQGAFRNRSQRNSMSSRDAYANTLKSKESGFLRSKSLRLKHRHSQKKRNAAEPMPDSSATYDPQEHQPKSKRDGKCVLM